MWGLYIYVGKTDILILELLLHFLVPSHKIIRSQPYCMVKCIRYLSENRMLLYYVLYILQKLELIG